MRINTNTAALNAWKNLTVSDEQMSKSLEKLSSGNRISKASDDAAGMAISEKMKAQIGGLQLAQRNAQDGISLIQTAEGGLSETSSILLRMRDLSSQASTATLQDTDRSKIVEEFNQLKNELGRISSSTKFNGTALLNGGLGGSIAGVGTGLTAAEGIVSIKTNGAAARHYMVSYDSATHAMTVTKRNAANTADEASQTVTMAGGEPTGFNNTSLNFSDFSVTVDVNAALDADIAVAGAEAVRGFTVNAGTAAIQIGADGGTTLDVDIEDMSDTGLGLAASSVDTTTNASASITAIDNAIGSVSTQRAKLGAYQNRLEHTIANLGTTIENLTSAGSRVKDVDMALEMASFTKGQILQQAGTAMLAQANQRPQTVMQLLRA